MFISEGSVLHGGRAVTNTRVDRNPRTGIKAKHSSQGLTFIQSFIFYFMSVGVLPACMRVCVRVSEPLKLELPIAVSWELCNRSRIPAVPAVLAQGVLP